MQADPILRFDAVTKSFPTRSGPVEAVRGVSFALTPGRVFGIVGQSGSGKSTLANMMVRAELPTAGRIHFEGRDITGLRGKDLLGFRRAVQMVFQDPFGSLNPRYSIGRTVTEPLLIHGIRSAAERQERATAALEAAELRPAAAFMEKLPHELSGGQRQRVAIARALVIGPRVVVADEPVTMLDVSARAGVLRLLRRLVDEQRLALAFITHDLSLIPAFCDEVVVMHRGLLIERGTPEAILTAPQQDYTRQLIAAIPLP